MNYYKFANKYMLNLFINYVFSFIDSLVKLIILNRFFQKAEYIFYYYNSNIN